MSKAITINLGEELMNIWNRIKARDQLTPGQIPAVGPMPGDLGLSIMSLPSIITLTPHSDSAMKVQHAKMEPASQTPSVKPANLLIEDKTAKDKDLHLTEVSILKSTGYSIKEVKPLPSGEQQISISDLFDDLPKKTKEFEYAYRSVNKHE